MTRTPAGSSATLSSVSAAAPLFTPDLNDEYEIQLIASHGARTYVGYLTLTPPTVGAASYGFTEQAGTAAIAVTLSEALPWTVTADWTTIDGSARAGSDYVAASGSLAFNPGETSKTINIQLLEDSIVDRSESFGVNFSKVTNALGAGLRIDVDKPTVAIDNVTVTEGNRGATTATFTVTLSSPSDQEGYVYVYYKTEDGTATSTSGTDYTAASDYVRLQLGATAKQFTVQVIGDSLAEGDESFSVILSDQPGSTYAAAKATCTILDDDVPIPGMSIDDVVVTEGDDGTTTAFFTVKLDTPSVGAVSVAYATANISAAAGSDYASETGTLTFAPGEGARRIGITVNGDRIDETDETFMINLTSPANATITDAQGIGTILDDDTTTISVGDVTVAEGHEGVTDARFTVSLSTPSASVVTVGYATSDATATAGSDYAAIAPATLTFAPGESSKQIVVAVMGDVIDEGDERFHLTLSNPFNAVIADASATATITNDDHPTRRRPARPGSS